MHLSIKVVLISLILIVVFVVLVGLMTDWGRQSSELFKGLVEWFSGLF